ncbi:GTPase Rab6/YPT6/Ryh1, small G protein superfamily [Pseudoloma neurophilia]|uniref:GTPase Rab6/YPT6/Ryh1, small G protein superfamily n=1 Tax=Pseudoloma neurophilia TaxID=146866 RepID=A0A0R0LZH3_9MICR|nr:GTPase Rab6/YPT6/Ryh1, small G protein superfamily [Pseudoloma neurophilia]
MTTASPKYKIVFLGDQSVGKTTLISQMTNRELDQNYQPTIGIDFTSTKINYNGKIACLQFWDTAGQERFNSLIPNYTRSSFIAIIMFDLKHMDSFNHLDHWIKDLVLINDPDRLINIIIVGNKKDLITDQEREEIKIRGVEKSKEYKGKYFETCSLNYKDITDLNEYIKELVLKDLESGNLGNDEDIVDIHSQKKGCC